MGVEQVSFGELNIYFVGILWMNGSTRGYFLHKIITMISIYFKQKNKKLKKKKKFKKEKVKKIYKFFQK